MAGCEASASARWLSFCRPCSHFFGLNAELTSKKPKAKFRQSAFSEVRQIEGWSRDGLHSEGPKPQQAWVSSHP
jgi:hypothetical protein